MTGKALAQLFAQRVAAHYAQQHLSLPDYLIAVPLHWRRQWQRGFNQAQWLTDHLAQHLNIHALYPVKKTTATRAQEQLSRKQRLRNVAHRFRITRAFTPTSSIAIVDDVMTTGATANSLAKTLKQAGVSNVSVWALARTPQPRHT